MQLEFAWLRRGDQGDLLQPRQTLFFIGLSLQTVIPVGPSSLRELAHLTVLCDTRPIPKRDPAQMTAIGGLSSPCMAIGAPNRSHFEDWKTVYIPAKSTRARPIIFHSFSI
jgi:hypothetical protein